MQTKYSKRVFITLIILIVSLTISSIKLTDVFSSNMVTFQIDNVITYTADDSEKIYVLYDAYFPTDFYTVRQVGIYTKITFDPNNEIFVHIKNLDTNTTYYVDGYGEYSSVKINNYDALGTVKLDKGTYEITITPATIDFPSSIEFAVMNTSIFANIFILAGASILSIFMFILLIYFYGKYKKERYHNAEFDGDHYEHADINALFDEDDPYGDKHGKDPYGFENEDDPYEQQRRR